MNSQQRNQENFVLRQSNVSTNATSKIREIEPQQIHKEDINSMPVSPKMTKTRFNKDKDGDSKDEFGITRKLRVAINKKYEVIEIIGNGSYG